MKNLLNHLLNQQTLSYDTAKETLLQIGRGEHNAAQIASFLTVFSLRGITVEELQGFRDAMIELCLSVDLQEFEAMDVCGTGGDGKDTFNISTLSAFVVAGAGQRVAKHGNHGVSSAVGSSTVLEYLGYQFTNDHDKLRRQLDTAGVCYLHAPLFHPAMKHVAPIRKELGIRTFFNMLGPLTNPARPKKQMVGVFNLDLMRLYAYLYQQSDHRFLIVHALDGYDEVSLTGDFKIITPLQEQILSPNQLGLGTFAAHQLHGGDTLAESARIFENVLNNQATLAQTEAVLANSALALHAANPSLALLDAVAAARESLESKRALACFTKFITN
ncbi:MAG: anthranilate phosphoribosyltransferase [Runella slithyformis]|nr:MAG: anthranilate phosphoribosyltransferase [Runella slithyformis]TAF02779.1 MAG: anthranilate phosphoribosyltransferase [Runella slithyformis]TAF29946.1 MAG: anthranilate phosphoribosyltransferase [Runella slithyformis]TAF49062.1 MAG: anthranilate phosphoribosyltransferase [Runella slithyformis]TAF79984.1 MAG: anthranilate phosphoribosyltransferase [Runella slithyformis]